MTLTSEERPSSHSAATLAPVVGTPGTTTWLPSRDDLERQLTKPRVDTGRGDDDLAIDGSADRTAAPDRGLHPTQDAITRISPTLHRLERDGATVGWVELAGGVFVGLRGAQHLTAEEIGQSLDFDCACALVWN